MNKAIDFADIKKQLKEDFSLIFKVDDLCSFKNTYYSPYSLLSTTDRADTGGADIEFHYMGMHLRHFDNDEVDGPDNYYNFAFVSHAYSPIDLLQGVQAYERLMQVLGRSEKKEAK